MQKSTNGKGEEGKYVDVEELKNQVIQAISQSDALQLEVNTLEHEQDEDQTEDPLPVDAKAKLMG